MNRLLALVALTLAVTPVTHAAEVLRWERVPLRARLLVGQERVILVDRNVRVGVPATAVDRLRVQSAGGAIYLRADAPLPTTRLELQDAESGGLILLDITAESAAPGEASLAPIRIVEAARVEPTAERDAEASGADFGVTREHATDTPIAVALTRYAAQSLYAPLRAIASVVGISPVALPRALDLHTLLPTLPIRATAHAAWQLNEHWVTAVKLTNQSRLQIDLDPRLLQGDFLAATFQHTTLGPAGDATDTTVVYVVTRGHGLAASLLPAIAPFDSTPNVPDSRAKAARP